MQKQMFGVLAVVMAARGKGGSTGGGGKSVTKRDEDDGGSLVLIQENAPAHIKTEGNRGSENVGTDDLVIPRLEIVQALSPAVKKGDPGYIKGAELGDLTNSVTRKNYGESVLVIPVHYTKQ